MSVDSYFVPPRGGPKFVVAPKGPQDISKISNKELAYLELSKRIGESFPSGTGFTVGEVYSDITGPMGLSYDDTKYLVAQATKSGYLARGTGRRK